jgi:hypothetical protein
MYEKRGILSNHEMVFLQFGQILRPFVMDIPRGYRQERAEINDPKIRPIKKKNNCRRSIIQEHTLSIGRAPNPDPRQSYSSLLPVHPKPERPKLY